MGVILNIDTAVQTASICLARDRQMLGFRENSHQKDHAGWIQVAISEMMESLGIDIREINAVAVSAGPGSYTGLRVGMASAKGLCYALGIPLITINTLKIMANAGRGIVSAWMCPMIDARRMEVFTAVYDQLLNEILPPKNMVLDENCFTELLQENHITFFGNGSEKFNQKMHHKNAQFIEVNYSARHMISLSYEQFSEGVFTSLAYAEPYYGKEFYSSFK